MTKSRGNHPANKGKVMLTVWVDAPLREQVRARAKAEREQVSDWVARELMRAVAGRPLFF